MTEKDYHISFRTIKTKMIITYQDEIGILREEIDKYGVSFSDGKAYFNDKAIDMTSLISIEEE